MILDLWKDSTTRAYENNIKVNAEIAQLKQKKVRVYELLEDGTYNGEEFAEQRNKVSKLIAEKETMLVPTDTKDINMNEVLEDCFNKIRRSDLTWLEYEKDHEKRLRFQKFIFDGNLGFTGEKFGTAKLSPIYSMYQQYLDDPSSLVT